MKINDITLYQRAFAHKSYAKKKKKDGDLPSDSSSDEESKEESNERLEFVGDSVLSAIVANYLFDMLGIDHLAHRRPSQLSGGQQQRVAIARALMHQPQLVLADEPTGNLDEATSNTVIELLESAASNAGATLVVITHSASIASHLSHSFRLGSGSLAPAV